ncbi:hypothetical protein [Alishewanella longhuensis]
MLYLAGASSLLNETVAREVPAPEHVLGFQVGEWHARHDQIQRYFEVLAAQSAGRNWK